MARTIAILAVLSLVASGAGAGIVVSYDMDAQTGGNMSQPAIQGGLELDGDGNANDGIAYVDLDTTTPYTANVGDYNGPPIFLGFESVQYNTGGAGWDNRDSNPFNIRNQNNGTDAFGNSHASDQHLVFYMEVSPAGSYLLDATSSLSTKLQRNESLGAVRWLVRDGTNFYVSQGTLGGGVNTLDGQDLVDMMWALFDPVADVDFDAGSAVFNVSTAGMTDLNAFGLVTDQDNIASARHWIEMHTYVVDAVPEPASLVLLSLGGLAVIRRRRS